MQRVDPDDMNERIAAYMGSEPDALPTRWTPELVMERLVDAFDVLQRTVDGAIYPKSFGTAWPAMLREFHELIDRQTREQMEADHAEAARRKGSRPSSLQITRAEEASHWTWAYLGDDPTRADALQLWALAKALDLNLAKIIRKRVIKADALVKIRQADVAAQQRAQRAAIAREACAWANSRLAQAISPDHARRIEANARIRAHREIIKAGIDQPIRIKRNDVIPGKCFSRTSLDQWRKEAAAIVSHRLQKAGVIIR